MIMIWLILLIALCAFPFLLLILLPLQLLFGLHKVVSRIIILRIMAQ